MPRQKLRDAAFILPFFGLILIMPPFVDIFFSTRLLGGVPSILFYIFGVWTLLIILGALLSRRLTIDADTRDIPQAMSAAEMQALQAQAAQTQASETQEPTDADR